MNYHIYTNKTRNFRERWDKQIMNKVEIKHFANEEERIKFWSEEVDPPPKINEIVNKKCEFCSRFNFKNTGIDINKYGVSIFTTCSGDCEVPKEKRFKYCPRCGRKLTEEEDV